MNTILFLLAVILVAWGLGWALSHWDLRITKPPTPRDWMSADDRATIIQFHAIKDHHRKPRAQMQRGNYR